MKIQSFVCSFILVAAVAACGDDTSGTGGAGGAGGAGTGGDPTTTTATTGTAGEGGSGSTTTTTTTTGGGGEGGAGEGGAGGAGQGGQGGGAELNAAVCTDITIAPDNAGEGACIELSDTVACNPVTNEGCVGDEACDISQAEDGSLTFACYPSGGPQQVCDFCNEVDTFCGVGTSCTYYFFPTSVPAELDQMCAKYCCEDSECGDGVCQPFDPGYGLPGGMCLNRPLGE